MQLYSTAIKPSGKTTTYLPIKLDLQPWWFVYCLEELSDQFQKKIWTNKLHCGKGFILWDWEKVSQYWNIFKGWPNFWWPCSDEQPSSGGGQSCPFVSKLNGIVQHACYSPGSQLQCLKDGSGHGGFLHEERSRKRRKPRKQFSKALSVSCLKKAVSKCFHCTKTGTSQEAVSFATCKSGNSQKGQK